MSHRLFAEILLALAGSLCVADATWADASTASISGNVVAAGASAPISGAKISVFRWGINTFSLVGDTTTDADGNYQVDGIDTQGGFPSMYKLTRATTA
ncbi:MAG TPA: carboxypeptidase-like regulatory domain-containing protein [Rudaea sp.]|jgi:hypothetical protein